MLDIGEFYKKLESDIVEPDKDYSYWVCIAEKEDHYILHTFSEWVKNNGITNHFGLDYDVVFDDKMELDSRFFKQYNSLEATFNKDDEVKIVNVKKTKRKFKIV